MKNNTLKLFFLLLTTTAFNLNLSSQTTVHVSAQGTLSSLISESEKFQITDLTVSGNLNGTDICFLKEMFGYTSWGNATTGQLKNLNMSGANIVEGGDIISSAFWCKNKE